MNGQRLIRIQSILLLFAIIASAIPLSRSIAEPLDAIVAGAVRADATFNAIGVAWTVSGDVNLNSSMTVEYRKLGASAWLPAAPAVRAYPTIIVDGSPLNLDYWAASAMFLDSGQTYQFHLVLTDPDGGGADQIITASTRSMLAADPAGRQLFVAPGGGGGVGSQASPFLGLQTAADAAQPGDVFHVAPGTYSPFQIKTSGTPGHPIVFTGPEGGGAVVDGANTDRGIVTLGDYDVDLGFVIVENLVIRNGAWGVDAQNTHDILLSHNTITDVDNGVLNRRGDNKEYNQTISDNIIQGRLPWPGTGIPEEEGIDLRGTGNVVAFNRLRNFGDCISVNPFTGPSYGNDVTGNDISYCVDDGIEIDANQSNVRVWRNRVMNSRMGVSVQPIRGGPAYIFRNETFNLESDPIKMHNQTTGFLVIHNSGAMDGNAQSDDGAMWRNATFRDNLFLGTAYAFEFTTAPDEGFRDFDYDAWGTTRDASSPYFKWNNVRYNTLADLKAIGVETHGIFAHFSDLTNAALPAAYTTDVTPGSRDLRLVAGAPEIDAGVMIPNLDDPFVVDGKPDMGAFEYGQPLPSYGPRVITPDISQSYKLANRPSAKPGDRITYTIALRNAGSPAVGITVTDSLPFGVTYQDNLSATSGNVSFSNGAVTWSGDVTQLAPVAIRFDVTLDAQVTGAQIITNTAAIEDGMGGSLQRQAAFAANGVALYLPLVNR